jgi:hypothetical protein
LLRRSYAKAQQAGMSTDFFESCISENPVISEQKMGSLGMGQIGKILHSFIRRNITAADDLQELKI